eukprot:TRINITY_DN774236_c0_g1_i1.p1 TRINITY_DN774236_c0_g1~~TRINITY_DN774236_c0_g1_i1.p1  ORF type:complete len:305 (-),score=83.63 TRINITY_DN774236_c0_g1_i1:105-1019(-)
MNIQFRIATPQPNHEAVATDRVLVIPGDEITDTDEGFLHGHGTYLHDGKLIATVAGYVERVNQYVMVVPLKQRFIGDVGDVVIGRVTEVGTKRWKLDIGGVQDAVLQLSSINLPGGLQRRRTEADQLQMREHFIENDIISAEVQKRSQQGGLQLQTRNVRYGKLENGQLIVCPSHLMRRLTQHFVRLECGIDLIIGLNGFIWLTAESPYHNRPKGLANVGQLEEMERKRKAHAEKKITPEQRINMARIANSIDILIKAQIPISPATLTAVFDKSISLSLEAKELELPEYFEELMFAAQEKTLSS